MGAAVQGGKKRMAIPISKSRDNNFALNVELQFYKMSCLLRIYVYKELQYVSVGQLEVKIHIKMYFQPDPNFYIFVAKF